MLGENRSGRAIILMNLTNEYLHPEGRRFSPKALDVLPYVQGELRYFRERMRPVIFCKTSVNEDAVSSEMLRDFMPRRGEICLTSARPNAFYNTELASVLASLRVKNLTIVGITLCEAIIMTAASALEYGYSVVVPETCVYSPNDHNHQAALRLLSHWSSK